MLRMERDKIAIRRNETRKEEKNVTLTFLSFEKRLAKLPKKEIKNKPKSTKREPKAERSKRNMKKETGLFAKLSQLFSA